MNQSRIAVFNFKWKWDHEIVSVQESQSREMLLALEYITLCNINMRSAVQQFKETYSMHVI